MELLLINILTQGFPHGAHLTKSKINIGIYSLKAYVFLCYLLLSIYNSFKIGRPKLETTWRQVCSGTDVFKYTQN